MAIEDVIQPGTLPQPKYFVDLPDVASEKETRWIGIQTPSIDGVVKDFLWWKNFESDCFSDEGRTEVARFIARLKLGKNIDSVVGMPVDLYQSTKRNKIVVVREPNIYGVYVEAARRPGMSFFSAMGTIPDEESLQRRLGMGGYPLLFEETVLKAKQALPYLRQP